MDGHVLLVRFSTVPFTVPQANLLLRFHMWSGKLWLKPLHNSRYPIVKPADVEAYFKSRSKESLSSVH